MLISGLNKFSLLDYPGRISCVIFTSGCNLRCSFCHNRELVLPKLINKNLASKIEEKDFFNFLEKRKNLLDGISICGGEPTLQKDLKIFCKKIKDMGFLVKLDTNGRDYRILEELVNDKLVDYIAMDIKDDFSKIERLIGVKIDNINYLKSIKFILNSQVDYEFRSTLIKGFHSKEDIENMGKTIFGAKAYFLQNYRKGNNLDPKFSGESFSIVELNDIKNIVGKYVKNVCIRE